VALGPGYFAIELAKSGSYTITGLDISATFVRLAQQNASEAGVAIDFQQGDAAHLPFGSQTFDFLVCRAAFKNFADPTQAVKEMARVLRPGGRALIIDLRRDASKASIDAEVEKMHMSALNAALTRWIFRVMLLKRAYNKDEMRQFIAGCGFSNSNIQETPIGFEIWLEK
jgi:ubiquinone/menaquinone biosynthesis C-methylase UbiE